MLYLHSAGSWCAWGSYLFQFQYFNGSCSCSCRGRTGQWVSRWVTAGRARCGCRPAAEAAGAPHLAAGSRRLSSLRSAGISMGSSTLEACAAQRSMRSTANQHICASKANAFQRHDVCLDATTTEFVHLLRACRTCLHVVPAIPLSSPASNSPPRSNTCRNNTGNVDRRQPPPHPTPPHPARPHHITALPRVPPAHRTLKVQLHDAWQPPPHLVQPPEPHSK